MSGDIESLINPYNDVHFRVNCIYVVNSICIFALILPSFLNRKYYKYVRFGFMLLTTRNVYRLFDFEQSRPYIEEGSWDLKIQIQVVIIMTALNLHFSSFNVEETGHILFSLFFFFSMIAGLVIPTIDFEQWEEGYTVFFKVWYIFGFTLFLFFYYLVYKMREIH